MQCDKQLNTPKINCVYMQCVTNLMAKDFRSLVPHNATKIMCEYFNNASSTAVTTIALTLAR